MTSPTATRASLYPILTVNFVGSLGFGIVLPFLIFLVTRLGGNALIYGLLGATYSVFQLIGAPILGKWSDRYGRRRILLLSQLGTLISWGIFLIALIIPAYPMIEVDSTVLGAFTLTLPLVILFLARAFDGATGGNVSVANAYLADITPDAERGANFGKMAVSSNLGFIAGPALAGILGATVMGETLPVLAAFAISLFATVFIAVRLPESSPCVLATEPETSNLGQVLGPDQRQCYRMVGEHRTSMRDILALPGIRPILIIHFLVFLAFNFFYVAFPVHIANTVGWSLTETGVFFAILSLMMTGVQGPLLSRISGWASDISLILWGSAVLGASFLFFPSINTVPIYMGAALLALGNGLMWPSLLALLSKTAESSVQGAVQGFAGSSSAVASIIGFLLGGVLYGRIGGVVFGIAGVITGVGFLMALLTPSIRTAAAGSGGEGNP